jgi:hypothetical protein
VVIVRVTMVEETTEKLQFDSAGNPAQLKLIVWEKPPSGVTVNVVIPDCPGAVIATAAGVTASLKSWTSNWAGGEFDPAKVASPL